MNPADLTYTNSSLATARDCLRRYDLQYLQRLNRIGLDALPLAVGTAWHKAHEARNKGEDPYAAIDWFAPNALWAEKLRRLFAAHEWRWQADDFEFVESELTFRVDIGGMPFEGQIDGIVRDRESGRLGLLDYKTTSDSLAGDYFDRLRLDVQVGGIYAMAFRELHGDWPAFILYDVTRKPTIKPKALTKADIARITGGDPTYFGEAVSESALAAIDVGEKGESVSMYGARLTSDIGNDPDKYFARRAIPRSPRDYEPLIDDLRAQVGIIQHAIGRGHMPRNPDACNKYGRCPFAALCELHIYPRDTEAEPPEGYERRDALHPELVGN